ncbi:MAG TPA: hypothetical protein VNP73_01785 [Actinomycetota bacterium]|nr:hypothetical protein [Actinomycetota bacterium]
MESVEQVKTFLRGQNLEQVDRTDEAIELYETCVGAGFDATGPYDRLITIYSHRAQHGDVIRVAELALKNVQTYADKKAFYERMKSEAAKAAAKVPPAAKKRS